MEYERSFMRKIGAKEIPIGSNTKITDDGLFCEALKRLRREKATVSSPEPMCVLEIRRQAVPKKISEWIGYET